MTDEIVAFSQDTDDGSYTFGFSLDNGTGLVMSLNVNITKDQAANIDEAKVIALQTAADAKQEWMDAVSKSQIIGPVDLPMSTKMAKLQAQLAQL